MNKKLSLLFVLLLLLSPINVNAADNVIKKSKEFTSISEDYSYKAEKEIYVNKKKYVLKNIKYKVISKKGSITKNIKFTNLKNKELPGTKEIDGKTLFLDKKNTIFDKKKQKAYYIYKARNPYNFNPEKQMELKDETGAKFIGVLKDMQKGNIYKNQENVIGTFKGTKNTEYYVFPNTGKMYALNNDYPKWKGYEKDILEYLNLNTDDYSIVNSEWIEQYNNGIRRANFTLNINVCDYRCTYVNEADNIFTANATYISPYKVKAIISYEKEKIDVKDMVIIGASVLIVFGVAISSILFILRKKRNIKIKN